MEIHMTSRLPSEWVTKKPIEEYETQFLYVGLSRYDTVKKTLSCIVRKPDGKALYTESPYEGSLARCYVSEFATVTIYSLNPRVWLEDLGINDRHAFVQKQPIQDAFT
jgi:hypothetical protein